MSSSCVVQLGPYKRRDTTPTNLTEPNPFDDKFGSNLFWGKKTLSYNHLYSFVVVVGKKRRAGPIMWDNNQTIMHMVFKLIE